MIQVQEVPKCREPIAAPMERPSVEDTLSRLKGTVGASLKQALEKQIDQMSLEDKQEGIIINNLFIIQRTDTFINTPKKSVL